MARLTLDEFRARLLRLSNERGNVMERATARAALAVKRETYASALARVRRTPKPAPRWVGYKVVGDQDGAEAKIRARGGFAYLADLGSYKHPQGYPMRPHKRRAKFAESGARRAAWHPPIPAQAWWQDGVDRAAPSITRIYYEAVSDEVARQFR